jgi:hypothetical protein
MTTKEQTTARTVATAKAEWVRDGEVEKQKSHKDNGNGRDDA